MLELTLALIVFLLPLAYSPGPGNMFFAAIGARFGTMATAPATLGYHVATWVVTAAIGLAFAGASTRMPAAFEVIRYAGSAYVLWLAWLFLRAGATRDAGEVRPATFLDGAVLLVFNPKAYVIIALMFSQFLHDAETGMLPLVLWITTVFTLNNFIAFTAWTVLGDVLTARFRTETQARRLNLMFGLMLAGVAICMLHR